MNQLDKNAFVNEILTRSQKLYNLICVCIYQITNFEIINNVQFTNTIISTEQKRMLDKYS